MLFNRIFRKGIFIIRISNIGLCIKAYEMLAGLLYNKYIINIQCIK